MTIDLLALLQHNDPLLLFVALSIGTAFGSLKLKGFVVGKTLGSLFIALFLGHLGFQFTSCESAISADQLGLMLFIFCMGIEAGPRFFSILMQDGLRYIALTFFISIIAIAITLGFVTYFDVEPGFASGILAGSTTSTPALLSAQDAIRNGLVDLPHDLSAQDALDIMGISYAITYMIGLLLMIITAHYAPIWLKLDISAEATKVARARGLNFKDHIKTYLPIIRAYRVGPELAAWIGGRTLRETGIYPHTGCYIERIRRNGILANPDGDAVIQEGDEIALVGFPESHEKLDLNYRNGKEVFDRNLLDLEIMTAEIILTNTAIAGCRLSELNLTNKGCFLNRITRQQIEMPNRNDIILQKGDILRVSGERQRIQALAQKIGFIHVHSNSSHLSGFSLFAVIGLLLGAISLAFGQFKFALGNSVGLMFSGILLGYIQANNPSFGYVPSAALKFLKEFGLTLFMVGLGLKIGNELWPHVKDLLGLLVLAGVLITTIPLILGYLFGIFVLKMNPALLMGALTGTRTCAAAMEVINNNADNGVPSLGYAGTYAIANVMQTITGALLVMFWL